jgi:hypothetical protein
MQWQQKLTRTVCSGVGRRCEVIASGSSLSDAAGWMRACFHQKGNTTTKRQPQHSTAQHNTRQQNKTKHNITTQHNTTTQTQHTTQHNNTTHNTTQHNNTTQHTTQHNNTTQHNTTHNTQHNTQQHNTTHKAHPMSVWGCYCAVGPRPPYLLHTCCDHNRGLRRSLQDALTTWDNGWR